jgi:predicted outer membrane repeat protein
VKKSSLWPLAMTAVFGSGAVSAATLNVPAEYSTIQAAIDAAAAGDEVIVSPGTYAESIDFLGKAITVRSTDPSDPSTVTATVIDPGGSGSAAAFISAETTTSVLQGLKLTGGGGTVFAIGPHGGESLGGGGVYCHGASPTIADCVVEENDLSAAESSAGGGIYVVDGSPRIERCDLVSNKVKNLGGAVYVGVEGSCALVNCSVRFNSASANGGGVAVSSGGSLTWTGDSATGNSAPLSGGALYIRDGASAIISDCVFSQNSTSGDGGAIALDDAGAFSVTACDFDNSSAGNAGGSVAATRSSTTLRSCTFETSQATSYGGSVFIFDAANAVIDDCTISGSSAWEGGGVWLNSPGSIAALTMSGCSATWAGGIYLENASPAINGATLAQNTATASGGAMICADGACPSFNACTFSQNTAQRDAGGVACWAKSSPSFINCVIGRNQATTTGGGMRCTDGSSPYMMNCTISGNVAGSTGGPMTCSGTSLPTIVNTIIWGNQPTSIYAPYSIPRITYSDVQGGWYDEGNLNSDPLFLNESSGDYRLMPDSPCLDAGTPFRAPDVDNEGHARPTDDGYEIGADEFIGIICDLSLTVLDFTPTLEVGEVLQIDAQLANSCPFALNFTDVRLRAEGPATAEFILINSVDITLRPGQSGNRTFNKQVPPEAPPGSYAMTLEVMRGLSVVASASFSITVTQSGDLLRVPQDYATIQAAILAAADGDQIEVAPGTYSEWGIQFLGKEVVVRSSDPADTAVVNSTIIDGNGQDHIFLFTGGEGHTSQLRGLTLRNGYAREGGGISCLGSSPTIANCVITGCNAHAAGLGGGAIYGRDSDLVLRSCTIVSNLAVNYGGGITLVTASSGSGGILAAPATPELLDCTIESNMASNGAGIFFSNVHPTMTNCIVRGNTGSGYGGGVFGTNSGSAAIDSCTIEANQAGYGGGICLQRTATTLQHSLLQGNRATATFFGGGGIRSDRSALTVLNSTFASDTTAAFGGAISATGGSTTIKNSILRDCVSSGNGGGIYASSNPVSIYNCTVVNNSAAVGRGIYAQSGGTTTGENNIFRNGGDEMEPPHRFTIDYSIVEGGWSGTGNLDLDPLFRNPASNDYHLQSTACGDSTDSPAIDTGNPATADNLLDCAAGLGTTIADMGAFGGPGND